MPWWSSPILSYDGALAKYKQTVWTTCSYFEHIINDIQKDASKLDIAQRFGAALFILKECLQEISATITNLVQKLSLYKNSSDPKAAELESQIATLKEYQQQLESLIATITKLDLQWAGKLKVFPGEEQTSLLQGLKDAQLSYGCLERPVRKKQPSLLPVLIGIGLLLLLGLGTIVFVIQDEFNLTVDDDAGLEPIVTVPQPEADSNRIGGTAAPPTPVPTVSRATTGGGSGQPVTACGDGVCASAESAESCAQDCGSGLCEANGGIKWQGTLCTCGGFVDHVTICGDDTKLDNISTTETCTPDAAQCGAQSDGGGTGGSSGGSCPCSCSMVCASPEEGGECVTTCTDCNGNLCRP